MCNGAFYFCKLSSELRTTSMWTNYILNMQITLILDYMIHFYYYSSKQISTCCVISMFHTTITILKHLWCSDKLKIARMTDDSDSLPWIFQTELRTRSPLYTSPLHTGCWGLKKKFIPPPQTDSVVHQDRWQLIIAHFLKFCSINVEATYFWQSKESPQ